MYALAYDLLIAMATNEEGGKAGSLFVSCLVDESTGESVVGLCLKAGQLEMAALVLDMGGLRALQEGLNMFHANKKHESVLHDVMKLLLTRDHLKRIAAIAPSLGSTQELAKLIDMGYSPTLSAYVLRYYQHNLQGAIQWLVNDQNYDDIRHIGLQSSTVDLLLPSPHSMTSHYRLNAQVKETLLLSCSTSADMLSALRQVPRESFVPRLYAKEVEDDHAIAHPLGYTLPSMYQCLQVLEALNLEPGVRVLDIGTGSGYFVTLLATLMGNKATISSWEQDADRLAYAYIYMAQSVQDGHNIVYPNFVETFVCNAFLTSQCDDAVFDRVHVGASCPRESVDLLLQYVALHGILVVPIDGSLYRIHKNQPTNDWLQLPVEPLGAYSIESLTPPTLDVLASQLGQDHTRSFGLHGFEERAHVHKPRVLVMDEPDPTETQPPRMAVNMLFQVDLADTMSSCPQLVQQGRSHTGLVVTRVGPTPVQLKELSMGVKISDASLRVRWIGWILPGFDPNPESGLGVGDDQFSYAYDGRRKKKWHHGISDDYWKQSCKAGDVVGCLLDLDQGNMSFMLNGTSLGVAYSDLRREFPVGGYSPACSMDGGESVWFNFGVKAFLYPPSHPFCPLAEFAYLPLLDLPSSPDSTLFVAKHIHDDAVAATPLTDPTTTILLGRNKIQPLDSNLSWFYPRQGRHTRHMLSQDLQHDVRIALARTFLASHMSKMAPADLIAYLSVASEHPEVVDSLNVTAQDIPWLVDTMQRQLETAADAMVIEESRHPMSHRLMSLTPTVIVALKTLRTNLLDVDTAMEKGNAKGAMMHLQRATETLVSRTEREPGDHFQRCRAQLEATYQRLRSAAPSNDLISSSLQQPQHRLPILDKVALLKQALELFESLVSFPSQVPVDAVHGKCVGLSEAQSLRIEFDPRTVRTNWKLLFFKDAACTQRWPYVLSRDGFAPFIVPASHFYYTFQPDTTKTHFVPEWGYAFRVTPYIFARPTWSLWTAVQTHKSLQDMLITTDGAGSTWLQSILRYIRTPAAPEKVRVLSTLVLCLHRNRTRLPAALQPHLASFLWFVQPELNFLYRKSVKWRLHSNPYFQTLLQAVTSVSSVAEHRIQRCELIETVQGLDVMLPATWQPIIAKQFNPLTMLKQLFKQFEASIKTDVQRWHKNRRELWIRQVDQAYHPALLECGWATERNKWLRHVQAACTVGDVAMQLMVLAGFIDVESHTSSWGSQSYDWRKAVMGLTKTDLSEDAQLHVSGQWTDGHVVADNDLSASVAIDRMFEDSTKLFRVRQAENVHVIAAFEYKTSLIRKINVRLRKTYSNNSTPVTAGMVFVFPVYPTPEDMLKVGHYDYFTSDKYQSYVLNMRRRGLLPLP
ncbi:hypothetical protein DYB37_009115, partial [Aphanomyces astaci]